MPRLFAVILSGGLAERRIYAERLWSENPWQRSRKSLRVIPSLLPSPAQLRERVRVRVLFFRDSAEAAIPHCLTRKEAALCHSERGEESRISSLARSVA